MITLFLNISSLIRITNINNQYKVKSDMQNICEESNSAMICDDKILWIGKQEEINYYIKNQQLPFSITIDNQSFQIDKVYDFAGITVLPAKS